MAKIHPPWDEQTVEALNKWQDFNFVRPLTCPKRLELDHQQYQIKNGGALGQLVAHEDGFRCPCCDYAQDWAHDFMTQQERMDAAKEAFVNAIHNRAK